MIALPAATWYLLAMSVCAAVFLLVHLHLAVRAYEQGNGLRVVLALVIPGIGAVLAWKRGRHRWAVLYFLLGGVYLVLLGWQHWAG